MVADLEVLELLERAAIARQDKFHRLRRTHATWLHRAGGDATSSLGHYCDSVTRESYLDPRYAEKQTPDRLLFAPTGSGLGGWLRGLLGR